MREEARGGFLLGATPEGYAVLVAHAHAMVLETEEGVSGFAIVLPDPVLRASDLWAVRERIVWDGVDPGAIEPMRLGYFDQLAVLPGPRLAPYAPVLAFAALDLLLAEGVDHVFATTASEPVLNRASLRLLQAIGARPAGEVEEIYPEVGRILSQIHHLDLGKPGAAERLRTHPLARKLRSAADALCGPPMAGRPL